MAFGAFTSSAADEGRAQAPSRKQGPVALLLLAPGLAYLALFFLAPLISLILTSFQAPREFGDIGQFDPAFRWENYVEVIERYWPHIARSFWFAAAATIAALLFSYPLAYFIGVKLRRAPLWQALCLVLVIAPFFISFLLRTLAWKAIFADEAWVVGALRALSLFGPGDHLTGTDFSVIFGLTYNFIPFMCLPIYASLERLDLRYVEAGSDLYAAPATTFWKVTLPLSLPGVISGTLLTFIPAAGDFVNASQNFLGGPDTAMIGNVIEANFLVLQNFPAAAALSILLMGAILVLVSAYVRRSGTEELL